MLDACRRRADHAGATVQLYEQFVQDLQTPRLYGFVFCCAGAFQLIPRDEQLPALRAMVRRMQPGAELVLEMGFPGEAHADSDDPIPERRVVRADGAEIVLSSDEHGQMRYDLVRSGEVIHTEFETFVLHPTPRAEFEGMLRDAGLTNMRAWWPYTENMARENAPFAVYVCNKAAITATDSR
jgi:hypothetical protein